MLKYDNPYFFYAFGLLPILFLVFLLLMRWKKKALERFGDADIVQQLMPDISQEKQVIKFIFLSVAFCFLIAALIDPQIGSKEEEAKQEGVDLMICLDVSNSMRAEDLSPSRLARAKQAISKLTEKLHGDRLGIIVFAGESFVQLPITSDYGAAKLFLDDIDCDMVQTQGTAIGTAIDLATESFGKTSASSKAIIIITDGENHEDDANASAKKASEKGMTVHCIGMGSSEGAPIPIYQNKVRVGFKKDAEGTTVVTKLNEQMLTEISAAGNGVYVRATNTEAGLNTIMNELEKMQRSKFGSKHFTDYEDHFQFFTFVALLFFIIEAALTERKLKWWTRMDLFQTKK